MKNYLINSVSSMVGINSHNVELDDSYSIDDFLVDSHPFFTGDDGCFACEVSTILPDGTAIFDRWRVFIRGTLYSYRLWQPTSCSLTQYYQYVLRYGIKL